MSLKVLWLCNVPLPEIAADIGIPKPNIGGWLEGMAEAIKDVVDLTVVFPRKAPCTVSGQVNQFSYIGVPRRLKQYSYDTRTEADLRGILSTSNPDIVHIHGSEWPHCLAMVNAASTTGHLERTVVSVQGLSSVYHRHYMGHLPPRECYAFTLKDLVRRNSLAGQQRRFAAAGRFEVEALKRARHVIGRTTWDRACTHQINPEINYHFCNENLRKVFYQHKWELGGCEPHTIFTSQALLPLKGFHLLAEALALVIQSFPDARLVVAGNSGSIRGSRLKRRLWSFHYPRYIDELVDRLGIRERITYTGPLGASEMCEAYLRSHVFVMPSSIENSSNSLAEAMLLGVPCVASYVGGTMDMLEHKKEGFLFQSDAPYMMAHYICELLGNDDLARSISANARKHALVTHDSKANAAALCDIYNSIREC